LLRFPPFLFCDDHGVRDNANTRRQSLLLAFFLPALDVDIHVVRVSPLLLIVAPAAAGSCSPLVWWFLFLALDACVLDL
jgi:hypothetical protein